MILACLSFLLGLPVKHTQTLPESMSKSNMEQNERRSPLLGEMGNSFQMIIINIHFFLLDLQALKTLKLVFMRHSKSIPAAYLKGSFRDTMVAII